MADRLEDLPQRFDVWQADGRPLTLPGLTAEQPLLVAVVSRSEDQILAYELHGASAGADVLWQVLCKAMRQPETSEPHRPTEVQFSSAEWGAELRGRLEGLNVSCTVREGLEEIDAVFAELSGQLAVRSEPGLLDVPGVTTAAVASFFDAAALFHEQAPWKKTGERPIRVECAKFSSGPWYAVITGQAGLSTGLILYDSLDTLHRVQQAGLSEQENARLTSALVVSYGEQDDLPAADLEALRRHGWRIAGQNAHPVVYRLEPGLSMRPPLAWELELLDGCLRAVPEFLRKKTRRLDPLPLIVPTAAGELALILAWESP
jgi:hypothetical protein